MIPKVFRDEYGLDVEAAVELRDVGEGVLLHKPRLDVAAEFAKMARGAKKSGSVNIHAIEEEYEERMKRSGLL